MTTLRKHTPLKIDKTLALILLAVTVISLFWYQAIEWICTHNVLGNL